jgi:hypothetical protein
MLRRVEVPWWLGGVDKERCEVGEHARRVRRYSKSGEFIWWVELRRSKGGLRDRFSRRVPFIFVGDICSILNNTCHFGVKD